LSKYKISTRSLLSLILATAFFFYQLVLRMWPSMVQSQWMASLDIDEKAFGWITSSYYGVYALMQIPMAIVFDRLPPRWVFAFSSFLSAAAFFFLNTASSLWIAITMMSILGFASSICVIGLSKVILSFFPKDMYSRIMGVSIGLGLLGCMAGKSRWLASLISTHGFQSIAWFLSLGLCLLGLLMLLVMRVASGRKEKNFEWRDLWKLLHSHAMICLCAVNFLFMGAQGGFADVWGVRYLVDKGVIMQEALYAIQVCFLGLVLGSPLMPWLGKKIGDFWVVIGSGIMIAFLFAGMLFFPTPIYVLRSMMFFLGILCGYQTNLLNIGANLASVRLAGVTVGLLNSLNMLGASFFNAMIGTVQGRGGSHRASLIVIPVTALLGAFYMLLMKSSFIKKRNSS
jgi:MFS family permease